VKAWVVEMLDRVELARPPKAYNKEGGSSIEERTLLGGLCGL
jgi:hypothetical protein